MNTTVCCDKAAVVIEILKALHRTKAFTVFCLYGTVNITSLE